MGEDIDLDADGDRLAALHDLAILDSPPEPAFDDIVEVAAALCDAPIALVSLVDRDRQWFKARVGLDLSETPIDQSVCALAITQDDVFVVEDLAADTRTCASALVNAADGIRFYAGAPLIVEGQAIGSLCVIDTQPRAGGLTPRQSAALQALARQVVLMIEARYSANRHAAEIRRAQRGTRVAQVRLERSEARSDALEQSGVRLLSAQEAGRIGTFEVDIAENLVTLSPEACRLFGVPVQPSYASPDLEALMLDDDGAEHSTLGDRADGSSKLDVEYRIRRADTGEVRWLARRGQFEHDEQGRVVRMRGTIHDITERRLAGDRIAALLKLGDLLRELDSVADIVSCASEILALVLDADRCGYATVNLAEGMIVVERDFARGGAASIAGNYPAPAFAATVAALQTGQTAAHADVEAVETLAADVPEYRALGIRSQIKVPLIERGELRGILFVHGRAVRVWHPLEIAFAETIADYTYAAIAKVRAEDDRKFLNHELSHRLKNTMAMIQAIAVQTLKGVTERDAVEAFSQRLMALSAAHDVLLQESWTAARIDLVIAGVLGKLGIAERFEMTGPVLMVGPRSVLGLSLLIHELATNALKYGGLSVPDGQVHLQWGTRAEEPGAPAGAEFFLHWRERGGPPSHAPDKPGFGSRLISMGLLGTGGAAMRYLSTGLEADFAAPLDRVKSD